MAPKSKTTAKLGYRFDRTNPEAVAWAKAHAGDLVEGITKTTREAIRELIGGLFEGDIPWAEVRQNLIDIFDDPARVKTIAHTEAMTAANEGQKRLWDQAVKDGYLDGNERVVWIVTPDDKLCPECEALEDTTVSLGQEFSSGGPPAHPNCRCTVGLVAGKGK
jgi:hypothetical protein